MPTDVVMSSVYRSLSGIVRFNAITPERHTVLEHSWNVGKVAGMLAPRELVDLAGFMGMTHDFGEVVVGDFVMPIKSGVFKEVYEKNYLPLERAFRAFVGGRLGIEDYDEKYGLVEKYVDTADGIVWRKEFYDDGELDAVIGKEGERHGLMYDYLRRRGGVPVAVEEFNANLMRLAGLVQFGSRNG